MQAQAATETFKIPRRSAWEYLGEIKVEIECNPTAPHSVKLGLAVQAAVKSRPDLSWADLSRANLSGANLSRANLSGADLSGANLSEANLSGANLSWANLSGPNLSRADLSGASLSGANLSWANLSGANLSRANLSGASLSGADLSGACLSQTNLSGANLSNEALRPFKADLWLTLSELRAGPLEALHLIAKLKVGEVDGSTYGSVGIKCACLVGTIAQAQDVDGEALDHNSRRPAERWFMMIRPGDKPENETGGGFAARKALEWAQGWASAHGIGLDASEAASHGEVA